MNMTTRTIKNSMNKLLFTFASLLGAIAIGWMGYDFAGTNTLAFAVTAAIGGVYLIGIIELLRFHRATSSLGNALAGIPGQLTATQEWLESWLEGLDPAVRGSVRLRIVGERSALPTPMFTPYLVGLLVMLGLLGTFIGMVNTLGGAVSALQGSTELDAIRASLTAPMQGLGVAFGTSVAGVAASAMLGLISTLVRHERIQVSRQLDTAIANVFKTFSLAHQRQQAYDALQSQAGALPAVAIDLQAVATQLAQLGDKLGETLLANQSQFHATTEQRFSELASSIDLSLRESLAASGKAAGESMQPAMTSAIAEISKMLRETQQQHVLAAGDQLRTLGDEFGTASTVLLEGYSATSSAWAEQTLALQVDIKQTLTETMREVADQTRTSTASMLDEIGTLLQSTELLVQTRADSESTLLDSQSARMEQLTATLTSQLDALRAQEEQGQTAALARLAELEGTVAEHLAKLGAGLEAPMTRLIETASETPRAAAEVISLLRAEITNNVERDNQLLEERLSVMQDLNALSESLQEAASGQRSAVEDLVTTSATLIQEAASGQRSTVEDLVLSSTALMQETTSRFGEHLLAEVSKMSEASAHVAGSAIELNSLGEAFGLAVSLFNSSNEAMMEHLSRVEESMERSSTRSDEQMSYYVAQAREIIDHSMLSQKEIMDDMRRINRKTRKLAGEAS